MDYDRQLAFALLAIRNGFLTHEQGIAALRAWSEAKKQSIGDHLVQMGMLSDEIRQSLESIFVAKLSEAGEDPVRCILESATETAYQFVLKFRPTGDEAVDSCIVRLGDKLSRHRTAGELRFEHQLSDHAASQTFDSDELTVNLTQPTQTTKIENYPYLLQSDDLAALGQLGPYKILELLGEGGFGSVFLAFDETLHRKVAIKVLKPILSGTSPPRKTFLREAKAAAAINHPNIVAVLTTHETPIPYIVMEYVDGETLKKRIDRIGPLDFPEVLEFSRQIAEGLAAAHEAGRIHRDIKPANIIIRNSEIPVAKLTDFGLARVIDDAADSQSGKITGTAGFMSPEQTEGLRVDARSDLFSLGSVIYNMVTGRPPFRARNMFAIMKRVANDTPRSISEIIPGTPVWFIEIVNKLMEKDSAQRFASAQELAELLKTRQWELRDGKTPVAMNVKEPAPDSSANAPTALSNLSEPKLRIFRNHYSISLITGTACLIVGILMARWVVTESEDGRVKLKPGKTLAQEKIIETPEKTQSDRVEEDIDRAVANIFRDNIGYVRVRMIDNDQVIDIARGRELPRQPFHLIGLWMDTAKPGLLDEETFKKIGELSHLEFILLRGFENEADRLKVTDKEIVDLFSDNVCKTLLELTLPALPSIKATGLKAIGRASALTSLEAHFTRSQFQIAKHLRFPKMEEIRITNDLHSGVFERIDERMPNVRRIKAQQREFSQNEAESISRLNKLEWLAFDNALLSDFLFEKISECKKIYKIDIDNCDGLTLSGLKSILSLPLMNEFTVNSRGTNTVKLSDEQIEYISKKSRLARLALFGHFLSEKSVANLCGLKNLTGLFLDRCSIGGQRPFKDFKSLDKLVDLALRETDLADEALSDISQIPNLQSLAIQGNARLTKDAIQSLRKSLRNCDVQSD